MRQSLKRPLQRIGYVILTATVILREAWLRWKQALQEFWRTHITNSPKVQLILAKLSRRRPKPAQQRGSKPRTPTVLGAVVVQSTFGEQDDQALCRLLAWAQLKGFHQVLLYDPSGKLQHRQENLVDSLQWVDSNRNIVVWSGWQPPQDVDFDVNAVGQRREQGAGGGMQRMGVAILSAADAEEPLEKAIDAHSSRNLDRLNGHALADAVAAPSDIKVRLAAAAGALAGVEPDFVVVFGHALTLAGFPPWAVRTAEVFEVGSLTGVTAGKMDAVLRKFLGTRQRFGR